MTISKQALVEYDDLCLFAKNVAISQFGFVDIQLQNGKNPYMFALTKF